MKVQPCRTKCGTTHYVLDLRKLSQFLLCKNMRPLAPAGVHGVNF
ncbi:MAG: hypothetical protein ACI9SB_001833 [Candidatus Azotimanducaceae bacterium]